MQEGIKQRLQELLSLSNIPKESISLSAGVGLADKDVVPGVALKSKTKTMNLPAVRSVLINATNTQKYELDEIVLLYNDFENSTYYFDLKYVVDHVVKTSKSIKVSIYDGNFTKRFCEEVDIDFYGDKYNVADINFQLPVKIDISDSDIDNLKAATSLSITNGGGGTKVGSIVNTKNNTYLASQYSGLDESSTIHSEICGLTQAISNGDIEIESISLMITKFVDELPAPCGNCLQVISELAGYYNFSPKIELYSMDRSKHKTYNIDHLLPLVWDNKLGEKHV